MEQWVKDKKAEAMRKRLMREQGSSYNLPSMAFTGAGKDGVVQNGRPAGMNPSGFIQHEGESIMSIPEGKFVMNAPTTQKTNPGMVYPSFAAGGFAEDEDKTNETIKNITETATNGLDSSGNVAGTQPVSNTDVMPGSPIQTQEDQARSAGLDYMTSTLNKTNPALMLEGKMQTDALSGRQQQERSAAKQQALQSGATAGQARVEGQILRNQQETELNNLGAQYGIAGMQARETAANNLATQGLLGQQFEQAKEQYKDTKAWQDFEYAAQYGSDQNVIDAYYNATGKQLDPEAVQEVRGYARTKRAQDITSGDIANDAAQLGVNTVQMQAIANDINNGAKRELINSTYGLNLTPDQFGAMQERYRQELSSGYLTIDAQTIDNEAAKLDVSSNQLTAFVNAVNSGADLDAANKASGLKLTPSQFYGMSRNYVYQGEEQKLSLDSMNNQFGQEKFDSIMDRIGSGASLDMVNDEFGTNLSYEDFQNMKSATPFGVQEFERQITAASMLMQTQDPANINQASAIYETIFPGVTFDMRQLIDDVGADRFAAGMEDVATLAATFDTWQEASESAIGLKLAEKMGIDGAQIGELFRGLKINQIDEAVSEIENSQVYQRLLIDDPDAAELMMDTIIMGYTGQLEMDVVPVYNVMNEDGDFVKKFDNIEDANTFLGENADKGYTIEKDKNFSYKQMGTGDTVIVNNNGEPVDDTTDTTISVNDAWALFEDSMFDLPDSVTKPTYTEWKNAWQEQGEPNNFTYDKYMKLQQGQLQGEGAKASVGTMADKYKTEGWPTLTTVTQPEKVSDRQPFLDSGNPQAKADTMTARQKFTTSPENTAVVTKDNAGDVFDMLKTSLGETLGITDEQYNAYISAASKSTLPEQGYDIFNAMDQIIGTGTSSNYRTDKIITIEGYDAPFYMNGDIHYYDNGDIKSVGLVNISTGALVWLNDKGNIEDNYYGLSGNSF